MTSRPPRQEQKTTNRILATMVFTVMEVWALAVVLGEIHASGAAALALAATLATAAMSIVDAWCGAFDSRQGGR